METKENVITPPRLIPSFAAGFNAVTHNLSIIIFPIILDIFLWLGPHLRIRQLFLPSVNDMMTMMTQMNAPQFKDLIGPVKEMELTLLERFNLFSVLRTLPIGVPSLMSSSLDTLKNPLGNTNFLEVPNFTTLLLVAFALAVVGIFAGSQYFYMAARISARPVLPFSLELSMRQWFQMLIVTAILILILLIIFFPVSMLFSLITMLNATIAQIVMLILSFFLLWILLPLVFSIHGVYARQQNFLTSALTSIRLVRLFLPSAGFFILMAIFINQGLGIVWTMAPSDSWMFLVGILGHAFIASGLLAASFVYYNNGIKWMDENMKRLARRQEENTPRAAA